MALDQYLNTFPWVECGDWVFYLDFLLALDGLVVKYWALKCNIPGSIIGPGTWNHILYIDTAVDCVKSHIINQGKDPDEKT